MNGQPYRADEFGFAALRIRDRLDDSFEVHTPAEFLGDIGAASGLVYCALAAKLMQRRVESRAPTFVFSCSDRGTRAAALMQPTDRPIGS
jgi:3-oxoacyl-[acyl-carrier-protein] synthase-1